VLTGANLAALIGCFRVAYVERLALLELAYDLIRPRRLVEPEARVPLEPL
jgi:hypothetical protein